MFGRQRSGPCLCSYVREASHAGSWYSGSGRRLGESLCVMTNAAIEELPEPENPQNITAVIAPHAGYSYSGPTAAYAYRFLSPDAWPEGACGSKLAQRGLQPSGPLSR